MSVGSGKTCKLRAISGACASASALKSNLFYTNTPIYNNARFVKVSC